MGPVSIASRDLMITMLSLLVLAGVGLLQQTRAGMAIRAVSDNRDLAESSDIDVSRATDSTQAVCDSVAR